MPSPAGLVGRNVLTTSAGIALAEPLDGELTAVETGCDMAFAEDHGGPPSPSTLAEHWASLLDLDTGELLGAMVWRAVPYGYTLASTAWNVGLRLLPAARGRGLSAVAGLMLARYLFRTTTIDRIEANTEVANVPGWLGLEKSGFHQEGITRGVSMRGGQRRDMLLYSLMRSDLDSPAGDRRILRGGDGVTLAHAWPDDHPKVLAAAEDRIAAESDHRPPSAGPPTVHRAAILDGDGDLVGTASWHAVHHGPDLAGTAWTVGVLVPHAPGLAAAAHRLLADYLFASTPLDRIEAITETDDDATRQALAAAAFHYEGTLRAARPRAGRRRDLALYGRLRTDG